MQYCQYGIFHLAADGNAFLRLLKSYCLIDNKSIYPGFIFVDFSFPNLRRFTDLQWADSLANSGMHIVLPISTEV